MTDHKPSLFRRWRLWRRRAWQAIRPGQRAWTGAALGLLVMALLFVIPAVWADFGGTDPLGLVLGFLSFALIGALAALAGWLVRRLLAVPPPFYVAAAAGALAVIYVIFSSARLDLAAPLAVIGVIASLLGAAVWVLARGGWRGASVVQRAMISASLVVGLVGFVAGGAWLLSDGSAAEPPANAAAKAGTTIAPLVLPDPSQPGAYPVRILAYGSGQDLHRPEYGAQADLITKPVNGSILVDGWSGLRRSYWGFGPEAMPLNGRVWYPDGEGPFPLVLIVHGNHIAEYFSDPGYAYLAELLASRGFIAVSVDENFLNTSPSADLAIIIPLIDENDARGWLLLEHLRAWKGWNETAGNPFYHKVDLQNIALIGHSRGGEAVVAAAAFNHLPYYPDDGSLVFDYGFPIRAVAAIAPVDGGYVPGGQSLPLENIDYFVLHGSQDMDMRSFLGHRFYDRLRFSGEDFHFKAALYIVGANHGQFNTVWGRKDLIEPAMRLYNLRTVMPAADQQQIAKVYLSAFLEAALHGETRYLPLLRDARSGAGWLPDTVYLTEYGDSATHLVSDFEGDLDLTTGALPGVTQQGDNLTVWREQLVPIRELSCCKGGRVLLDTRAAYLGWDVQAFPEAASYTVHLPEQELTLDEQSTLVFALGDTGEDPNPKELHAGRPAAEEAAQGEDIDLTVELADRAGNVARLLLSQVAFLQPRIDSRIFKAPWMSAMASSEIVLQSFEFPLAGFVQANPALDPATLAEVRLVFDRSPAGVVVLDDLGFR